MNYKSFIFWIKSCNYKLFFSNQLNLLYCQEGLGSNVRSPLEVPNKNIDFNLNQSLKKALPNNIYANVSHKKISLKKQLFFSFFTKKNL